MNTNLRSASAHIKAWFKKEYPYLNTRIRSYHIKNKIHTKFEEIRIDVDDDERLDPIILQSIRTQLDKYQLGIYYEDMGEYVYDDEMSCYPEVHRVRLFLQQEVET